MIHPIDLNRDLDELTMLRDRGPHTTEEEAQASIAKLADFRDGGVFASHFSGKHGWERHPKGDEIVQILEGMAQFDIIIDDVIETITTMRHRLSVRSLEIPAVQVVFRNCKTALVYQPMMTRAQQHQIIETGLTAS